MDKIKKLLVWLLALSFMIFLPANDALADSGDWIGALHFLDAVVGEAKYMDTVRINNTNYFISVSCGDGDDGWMRTWHCDYDGTLTTINNYEFDGVEGIPSITQVYGTGTYFVVWQHTPNAIAATISVSSVGIINPALTDSMTLIGTHAFWNFTYLGDHCYAAVSSNYTDNTYELHAFHINDSGTFTRNESVKFGTHSAAYSRASYIAGVDSNTVAICYHEAADSFMRVRTWNITASSADIAATYAFIRTYGNCNKPFMSRIAGSTNYAITYTREVGLADFEPSVGLVTITADGQISDWNDQVDFTKNLGAAVGQVYTSIFTIVNNSRYGIMAGGANKGLYCFVVNITVPGSVSEYPTASFNGNQVYAPLIYTLWPADTFLVAYNTYVTASYSGIAGSTHGSYISFAIETPLTIAPPTNIVCNDYNNTVVNISFDPFNPGNGTTYTICYYQEGNTAPAFGGGIFGGNVSGNTTSTWINITGLLPTTTYTFAFWTFWNGTWSGAPTGLSEDFSYITHTTGYGNVRFCLRYENVSSNDHGELINLTAASANSTHQLIIHYANLSSTYVYFNSSTYIAAGYTANTSVVVKSNPTFYEFTWNYSVNASSTEFQGTYHRLLTPHAEFQEAGNTICTFYLITNRHIYNQYYMNNNTYYLEDDINNLVDYSFQFDDQSGYFSPITAHTVYATIFEYTGAGKIIIDQRYVDSSMKIAPTLLYQSYFYIGISTEVIPDINQYYSNLPFLSTEKLVAPYVETITILPIPIYYAEIVKNVSTSYGWTWTGFWFRYDDLSSQTTNIQFTVYNNSNSAFLYTQTISGASSHNFTYNTIDVWHSNITYKVIINFSYQYLLSTGTYVTKVYTTGPIYVYPPLSFNKTYSVNYGNVLFTEIFGTSPFKNPKTGATVPYFDFIIVSFAIFFALLIGSFSAAWAGIGTGVYLAVMGSNTLFVDINPAYLIVGVFIVIMSLVWLLHKGGRQDI